MQSPVMSSKSLHKEEFSNQIQKLSYGRNHKQTISLEKRTIQYRNPEQRDAEIKFIVKQYLKDKNIQDLKAKFYTERLLKKRNRASIELTQSKDLKNQQNNHFFNSHLDQSKNGQHQGKVKHYRHECQQCKECNCKAHICQTNKIKFKAKDPVSKFQTNYTRANRQTKVKSHLLIKRQQITASYCSSQMENLPQYSPTFDSLNLDSSYTKQFTPRKSEDKVENFRQYKQSNVKFGPKQVKNYESVYQGQFGFQQNKVKASRTPQPFVVKQPQNLNNFGLKYNSINSNYSKEYPVKENGRRTPLKPPSLFKDLNVHLIKESFKEIYGRREQDAKTSRKRRIKKQKMPFVHHLSSSFIPLDGIQLDSSLFDSSYKKGYQNGRQTNDIRKYSCPHGVKSSNGAASKFY